jgi:hypothetical protein
MFRLPRSTPLISIYIANSVATTLMHTDKYTVVRYFLNKKDTPFAIEHLVLPWLRHCIFELNTCIFDYNFDGKSHQEAHKIRNCSPWLSS